MVEMTADEWKLYENICKSYDEPPAVKGSDMFRDLFVSNEDGLIVYLIPPKRMITMEVYLFVVNLMIQQHLRSNAKIISDTVKKMEEKMKEADTLLEKLETKRKK